MPDPNDAKSSEPSAALSPSLRNSLVHLPGAYPSQVVPSLEKLSDEDLFNHATWNILERFSRVTQLYRNTAGKLLEQSPIRPLIPPYLLSPDTSAQSISSPPANPDEFEPARVYLAQWAHDLQVSRRLESATMADEDASTSNPAPTTPPHIETRVEESVVPDLTLSGPSASTPLSPVADSTGMTWSVVSDGVASATMEKPKKLVSQLQYLRNRKKKKQKRGTADDSEDDQVVWDEIVEAETELGMFEVLSTHTTPPPPVPTRAPELTRSEWETYFVDYVPFPDWDSEISLPELQGEEGKLVKTEWEIRRRVFAGGVEPSLRPEVWGYLLGVYPWDSTHLDRLRIIKQKREEYAKRKAEWMEDAARLVDQRLLMSIDHYHDPNAASVQGSEELDAIASGKLDPRDEAVRDAFTRIEKDVMRTDRSHPFYAAADGKRAKPVSAKASLQATTILPLGNYRLDALRDVLMTYSCCSHGGRSVVGGYVQGMSDLTSPLLVGAGAGNEAYTFWCLVWVMERAKRNFLRDGSGMRHQLNLMERLLKLTDPGLHIHLSFCDALNLFCVFRWLLVIFRREFDFDPACRLWEVCWAAEGYLFPPFVSRTDVEGIEESAEAVGFGDGGGWTFVYFVALAIFEDHRDAMVRHLMNFDEVLKYVNDMTQNIPVESTLAQAELCFLRFRNHAISLEVYDQPRRSLKLDSVSSDASGTSEWTVAEVPLFPSPPYILTAVAEMELEKMDGDEVAVGKYSGTKGKRTMISGDFSAMVDRMLELEDEKMTKALQMRGSEVVGGTLRGTRRVFMWGRKEGKQD
ncbi:rab-GTPase-TBC domain-containing protein [Cladochytrium replicatum]|nr:rab-GTPase-TBC domain-containing protein [Cladochytrium replicatum]